MSVGTSLLIDAYECDSPLLTDAMELANELVAACEKAGATVLGAHPYQFPGPGGVTVWVCLAESGAEIHTYPERRQWFATIFTCGDVDPRIVGRELLAQLGGRARVESMPRGV